MAKKDYNFQKAVKPCGTGEFQDKPSGNCIEDAPTNCKWYEVCNLKSKNPWKKPTQPLEYRRTTLNPKPITRPVS